MAMLDFYAKKYFMLSDFLLVSVANLPGVKTPHKLEKICETSFVFFLQRILCKLHYCSACSRSFLQQFPT